MKLKDMCCVLVWMLLPLLHSCNIFLFPIYCRKSIWVCWAGDAPVGLSTEEVWGHGDPLCREWNQATCWNLLASTAKLYSSFLLLEDRRGFLGGHTRKAVYHRPQNWHGHSISKCCLRGPHQTRGEVHWSHLRWSFCLTVTSPPALPRPWGIHPY